MATRRPAATAARAPRAASRAPRRHRVSSLESDPETVARMLLGALVRGGMLIAGSAEPGQTRDAVARAIRAMLAGLAKG